MKLLAEAIDFKITFLYSFMIVSLQYLNIENSYKIISAFIFIGYNLHRWWIMWKTDQREQNKHKPKNKR